MTDWIKIKNEYISTGISTRKLAEKHGVSASAVMKKAAAEKWALERKQQRHKIEAKVKQKTASKIASQEADRITRLLSIEDKLADRLALAADQLDQKTVTHKTKTKTVEYGDKDAKGKPAKEVIVEEEILKTVDALIDRQGMQQLSAALKNLRDVALTGQDNDATGAALDKARELLGGVPSAID